MSQHNENDFVIPALKVVRESKEGCSTEFIKKNIGSFIEITEMDKTPYPSRSQNEPRYYQKVGNIISHNNPAFFEYVDVIKSDNADTIFKINEKGIEHLDSLLEKSDDKMIDSNDRISYVEEETVYLREEKGEDEILEFDFATDDPFDKRIKEYVLENGLSKRPPTDSKIKDTVIKLSGYQCEYGVLVKKKHKVFKGKDKLPYIEGHHLVPMKASIDFFPISLDRPSNIVPLCPGCHILLHRGSKEEKEKVLKVLFDNHKEQLMKDGIYITFEQLLDKYY